jgi:FMN phosphatase YigB (HAD superfamily)
MKSINDYRNIIFDLGGVVLNLDYNKTVLEYKQHIKDLNESVFFGKENQLSFFSDYEVGRISTVDFIKKFNEYYSLKITDEEFHRCWNAMIFDFPMSRILLIKRLRDSGKKILLLSNINELHEQAVEESYKSLGIGDKFFDCFDKVYYSHRIGLRKPNQEIFDFVVRDTKIEKHETIFIDDSLHHVEGSRKYGIDAIHLEKPTSIESHPFFLGGT